MDGLSTPLTRGTRGWWTGHVPLAGPEMRYHLRINGQRLIPDPYSRSQPAGADGPSEVVDLARFPWTDAEWRGVPLTDLVIYELHVETFTSTGTLDDAIEHLDSLVDLGVTAVEVMPITQTAGERGWGYDPVLLFAVQHSLGGPRAFQRFVDACHARGLAVVLDVVYNHVGGSGCHLDDLMPFSSRERTTPWGAAVNVEGPWSDGVRSLLLANVWNWFACFHVDGLRLDAVHLIPAEGARPFVAELAQKTRTWSTELGRPLHLIAEAGINDPRYVRRPDVGGYGLDAQWDDDFHHAVHALVTRETRPPSSDFGTVDHLYRAFARGFVYDGRWCESRGQTWGADGSSLGTERFVAFCQNHDQIGNRALGERLAVLVGEPEQRFAAGAVLLGPYLPLLFMGEEWGARTPFCFFVDLPEESGEEIRRSRREQFAALFAGTEPPDPIAIATRDACRLDWEEATRGPGQALRVWYRACLHARRRFPSLRPGPRSRVAVRLPHPAVITIERRTGACRTLLVLHAAGAESPQLPLPPGDWLVAVCSDPGASALRNTAGEQSLALWPWAVVLLSDQDMRRN